MEQISLPGKHAVDDIHRINPFVFCIITRSCNDNVMCYEYRHGKVNYFWLNLDKNYANYPKVEKPGKLDWFPYGWTYKQLTDTIHEIKLNQVPSRPITINTEPLRYHGEATGRPTARGYVTIQNQKCYLNYVHVEMEGTILIPSVKFIELFGHNRNHQQLSEKVYK